MEGRYLTEAIQALALGRHKMAFLSGPRQVGKTTLAKQLGKSVDHFVYRNWDEATFRRLWLKAPNSVADAFDLTATGKRRLLVLDEIHKAKGWKSRVKGIYDEHGEELEILVTGSARLNVYKKGSDSLMGRYLNFRLHPFSYGEITGGAILDPKSWRARLFQKQEGAGEATISALLRFSGFPEPFLARSEQIHNLWRKDRHEKIVREDLRDLSRIPELSGVELLASMLPEKVGSPLSVQSLREDLEVGFDTVKRWLAYLEELYFFFSVRPWSKSVPRSLKKEPKIYLYDYTEVESEGARFENLVAAHLLKACHYWVDTGVGEFDLHYLRNKEKEEVDFLVTEKKMPWLMVEVKKSDTSINRKVAQKFHRNLKCPFVQVVQQDGVWHMKDGLAVMSASSFLAGLP